MVYTTYAFAGNKPDGTITLYRFIGGKDKYKPIANKNCLKSNPDIEFAKHIHEHTT